MIEAALVFLGVGLLAAIGLLGPLLRPELVIAGGTVCTVAGLALGVPTGFWYHVVLRRCLLRRGELPERWWLRPAALHERVPREERAAFLLWFYLGGVGFVVTVLGCVVVVAGVLIPV